jgi:NADH:ubiquinone oxidoreductase subunit K
MTKKIENNSVQKEFIFGKKNYKFMLIGLGVIFLGFALMAGGASDSDTIFNPDVFSFRRIRLAPFVVLVGLGIEIYAILLNPNKQ